MSLYFKREKNFLEFELETIDDVLKRLGYTKDIDSSNKSYSYQGKRNIIQVFDNFSQVILNPSDYSRTQKVIDLFCEELRVERCEFGVPESFYDNFDFGSAVKIGFKSRKKS